VISDGGLRLVIVPLFETKCHPQTSPTGPIKFMSVEFEGTTPRNRGLKAVNSGVDRGVGRFVVEPDAIAFGVALVEHRQQAQGSYGGR
jgi:hypothetical protein